MNSAALHTQGYGAVGTSGSGVVKAVGDIGIDLSPGDLVVASAAFRNAEKNRVGLWRTKGAEIIVPSSSLVKIETDWITNNQHCAKDVAMFPLLMSAYHILNALKEGDTLIVDEQSTDCFMKAIIEVANARNISIESVDSSKRATIKGAKLAVTCRSGSNSVHMLRTLGAGGTLFIYNGPYVEPLDTECTVNIPVASAIFSDIVVRGFGGFHTWHQADPGGVREALEGIQILLNEGKLSLPKLRSNAKVFSLNDTKTLTEAVMHSAEAEGLAVLDLTA